MKRITIPEKHRLDADPDVRRLTAELAKLPSSEDLRRAFIDAETALTAAEERHADIEVSARIGKASLADESAARDAVEQAGEAVNAAKKNLSITDRQRTALRALLAKAENEASQRIAALVAGEIRAKAIALDRKLEEAAGLQRELDALREAGDQFTSWTVGGFAINRPLAKHGPVLPIAAAFSDALTGKDGLLSRWRRELA